MDEERNNLRLAAYAILTGFALVLILCGFMACGQMTALADEPKIIMNGKYVENDPQAGAIDIQVPPINRISDALDEVDANGRQMKYLGDFRLTYYCPCATCNGNSKAIDRLGNPLVWGTVAVDPKLIPLGTQLVIDGYDMIFTARDTGGKWVQGHHIDVYVPVSHKEALAMCVDENRKVWKVE